MNLNVNLFASVLLLAFGTWALIVVDNLVKKIFALNIISSSVVLFFITLGYRQDATAPILVKGVEAIVDPLPQALMLTAIVINLCMTALALILVIKIYRSERSLDESYFKGFFRDK